MNKPDALRLADELDAELRRTVRVDMLHHNAATELRRLHGIEFALRDCEKTLEGIAKKYMDAVDQRGALLEALERIAGFTMSQFMLPYDMALECQNVARAAIKAVEEDA